MGWDEHYHEQLGLDTPQKRAKYILDLKYAFESRLDCLWRYPRGYEVPEQEQDLYEVLSDALETHALMNDIRKMASIGR